MAYQPAKVDMPNLFLYKYTVLFQTIQFSIRKVFVYTQLNVKTVQFSIIQFRGSTVSMSKTFVFQTIQFSIQKQFHFKQFSQAYVRSLNVKTVVSQAIQFSISTSFSSFRHIDTTLSGATTPGPSTPGSDGNIGILCTLQSSSITGTSPSDCLVSYQGHSFSVCVCVWGGLLLCRGAVGVFLSPSRLGNIYLRVFVCLCQTNQAFFWYLIYNDMREKK